MTTIHVINVLILAGLVCASWLFWKFLSKWNLSNSLGSYHVRQCPSCQARFSKPIRSIDICEHCSALLSAKKIAITSFATTLSVALTLGVWIGVSTQAISGIFAGMAATTLLLPTNFLISKLVPADQITNYLDACEAMRFIWSQTEDYSLDLQDAVRLRVHTKVRDILIATFPAGSRVEYQNNIYTVREINDAMCCVMECGRDRIELPCGRLRFLKAIDKVDPSVPVTSK